MNAVYIFVIVFSVSSGAPIKDALTVDYEADPSRDFRVRTLPALVSLGVALATTPPKNPVMPFTKSNLDPPEQDTFHRMMMAALHAPSPMYNDHEGPPQPMRLRNNPIGLNTLTLPPDTTLISSPGPIPSVLLAKDLFQRVLFPKGVPLPKSWTQPKYPLRPSGQMKLFLASQLNGHVKKTTTDVSPPAVSPNLGTTGGGVLPQDTQLDKQPLQIDME